MLYVKNINIMRLCVFVSETLDFEQYTYYDDIITTFYKRRAILYVI